MAMQPYFSGHPFSYSRWRRSFMYQQSRTFLSAMQAINLHTKEIITLFCCGSGLAFHMVTAENISFLFCLFYTAATWQQWQEKDTLLILHDIKQKSNLTSNKTHGHKSGDLHLIGLQQMHFGLWICDNWCYDQLRTYCQLPLPLILSRWAMVFFV